MTPGEFNPYIIARIEWHKEQIKMENERFGLIAAKLHNMLGGKKAMQPSDFFTATQSKGAKKGQKPDQLEQFYSGMMAICKSGGIK